MMNLAHVQKQQQQQEKHSKYFSTCPCSRTLSVFTKSMITSSRFLAAVITRKHMISVNHDTVSPHIPQEVDTVVCMDYSPICLKRMTCCIVLKNITHCKNSPSILSLS